jgi:hypothetical protein
LNHKETIMYLTQRKWHHVPAQFQRLTAFAIITVLAFSVGWAAGAYGPAAYTFLTTGRNAAPAAAPAVAPASGLRIPNSVAQAPAAAQAVVAPQAQAQRYLLGGHGELVAAQPQAQRYLLGGHGELVPGASNAAPVVNSQALFTDMKKGQAKVRDIPIVPAVAADQAQQGVMNYVRAHNAVEGHQGSR